MFAKLKFNIALIVVAFAIATVSIVGPATNMFGKRYKKSLDYTCCKGDQLYVHHFYTNQFFWVEISNAYTVEPIGKPTPGGCNIQCED
jgi:hypothetical protein